MMVEFNENRLVKAVVQDCIGINYLDEAEITNIAYDILETWAVEDMGLLQILVEMSIKELEKMNEEIKESIEWNVNRILKYIQEDNKNIVFRKKDMGHVSSASELWYITDEYLYENIYDYVTSNIGLTLPWNIIKDKLVEALAKENYQTEV